MKKTKFSSQERSSDRTFEEEFPNLLEKDSYGVFYLLTEWTEDGARPGKEGMLYTDLWVELPIVMKYCLDYQRVQKAWQKLRNKEYHSKDGEFENWKKLIANMDEFEKELGL